MGGSMSSVIISGDTSGAITLAAPAVSGTNTITLPASTGTVLTTGSPQSGGVIQVVNATYGTSSSTTSTSFVDTGLTVSITPKFATSKILVLVSAQWQTYPSANSRDSGGAFQLVRGSTGIWSPNTLSVYLDVQLAVGVQINMSNLWSLQYLDSPATTSSTTYKLQYYAESGRTFLINQTGTSAPASIILMEIAA